MMKGNQGPLKALCMAASALLLATGAVWGCYHLYHNHPLQDENPNVLIQAGFDCTELEAEFFKHPATFEAKCAWLKEQHLDLWENLLCEAGGGRDNKGCSLMCRAWQVCKELADNSEDGLVHSTKKAALRPFQVEGHHDHKDQNSKDLLHLHTSPHYLGKGPHSEEYQFHREAEEIFDAWNDILNDALQESGSGSGGGNGGFGDFDSGGWNSNPEPDRTKGRGRAAAVGIFGILVGLAGVGFAYWQASRTPLGSTKEVKHISMEESIFTFPHGRVVSLICLGVSLLAFFFSIGVMAAGKFVAFRDLPFVGNAYAPLFGRNGADGADGKDSAWNAGRTFAVFAFLVGLVVTLASCAGAIRLAYSPQLLLLLLGLSSITAMFQLWSLFVVGSEACAYWPCSISAGGVLAVLAYLLWIGVAVCFYFMAKYRAADLPDDSSPPESDEGKKAGSNDVTSKEEPTESSDHQPSQLKSKQAEVDGPDENVEV